MPSGKQLATILPPAGPAPGAGLSYTAQLVVDRQSIPLASNTGIVQLASNPQPGTGFLIERISVNSNSATPTTARVYVGSPEPQNEMDLTLAGNEDVADEASPIYVPAGATFTIVWTGGSAGANYTARVQYAVIQFVPATYGGGG